MPTQLDLAPRHLAMLRRLLDEHVPMAEVWAFGSRINGKAHEGSDLDLVLRTPTALAEPTVGHMDLVDGLTESMLPILVEVHDWAELPSAFRREIERHYLVLKPATLTAAAKT